MLPNFILIGAMKSGTTSLYRYLQAHPDISGSQVKEPEYFSKHYDKGIEWYKSLFSDESELTFEASTGYTKRHFWPEAAERIYRDLPNVKLIYCLRDPVQRAVSNYQHNLAKGREKLPFSQAIRKPNNGYVATSKYAFQLEVYDKLFKKEQILVVDFEDFKLNPSEHMDRIFRFLGVKSEGYQRHVLDKVFHKSGPKEFEVSQSDIDYLRESFVDDVTMLRLRTGLGFSAWSV